MLRRSCLCLVGRPRRRDVAGCLRSAECEVERGGYGEVRSDFGVVAGFDADEELSGYAGACCEGVLRDVGGPAGGFQLSAQQFEVL